MKSETGPDPAPGAGADDTRLRRLRLRSWRRGTKEMDLILGPYADTHAAGWDADEIRLFEALLEENDQDLYAWVAGREPPPDRFAALIARIRDERFAH